jgi:p-methyltransferase
MTGHGELDAIIIADSGVDTLSGTNPLKLKLDGRVADIQVVANYIRNGGQVMPPVDGDNRLSWSSAPKLNGIFLYSFLTQRNFSVELIQNFDIEKKRFQNLLALKPEAVIISTPFIFFKQTLRALAGDIRSIAPDICIIAGGAFVYYSYLLLGRARDKKYETRTAEKDFLFLQVQDEPEVNLYIASPKGEEILCRALHLVKAGKSFDSLENSVYLDGGSYHFGPRTDDITHKPAPKIDWRTLPDSIFTSGVVPLQASNGCPYTCSFCNFIKDRRLTYLKPLGQLISELQTVQQRGAEFVWFVDDNFRLGRGDLEEICRRFIKEGIDLKWMCFIRASTLQNTDLSLLKKAGCIEVQIGLESGDPQILKNMNKKADPEMYRKVVRSLMNNGINVSCYFISGFPGETEESAARTRSFIRSIENPEADGALSWSIYPFLLSPLSPVYEPEMRKQFGLKGYMNSWTHKTMDFQGAKQLVGKAFFELENSGPIYRGDNLKLLLSMPPRERKLFYTTRHNLSKKLVREPVGQDEIIRCFQNFFT